MQGLSNERAKKTISRRCWMLLMVVMREVPAKPQILKSAWRRNLGRLKLRSEFAMEDEEF